MLVIKPIGALSNGGSSGLSRTLEDQYAMLREKCIEQYGPGFCNSVMPRNMVYALTRPGEGISLPWWAWMLLGLMVGKVLR